MKTIWKWILGILLVVLVVGALAAAAFMWRGRMASVSYRSIPFERQWENGPRMRRPEFGWQTRPLMRAGGGIRPLRGFLVLGNGLLCLLVLGALLYGAYWLGRRNARVVIEAKSPAAPPPAAPAPPVETGPPADSNPPAE
ncbi:MAG: hypothetical protein ACM3QS_07270 [Bacteroidota bacterium]